MISNYPPRKLVALRVRSLLTRIQASELTGITPTTIYNIERGKHKPQTGTLEKLLNLYAIRIKRLEQMEQIWGADGKQNTRAGIAVKGGPGVPRGIYRTKGEVNHGI